MGEVTLRPAQKADAAELAILDNIAGHGISLWFWQKAVSDGEGDNALELGRMRFMDEEAVFGWKNATIAESDNEILGSVTSYVMTPLEEGEEQFKRDASAFSPLFELFDQVVGDWFIDSLGVYSHARGRGIASSLVDDSLKRASASYANQSSLVVEDSNQVARSIYEKRGFEIRNSKPFIEFDGPSKTKEWLLMSVKL